MTPDRNRRHREIIALLLNPKTQKCQYKGYNIIANPDIVPSIVQKFPNGDYYLEEIRFAPVPKNET